MSFLVSLGIFSQVGEDGYTVDLATCDVPLIHLFSPSISQSCLLLKVHPGLVLAYIRRFR